ncbi:MBOAT family protein [Pedobacter sp. SYP-B3415]|uniref:MBOAT family O-acyltransferase n=1 Tax=Pedobacter sp. SYP-B3415 TaxID=2496641 RepID=UPI00101DBDA1|nr:MBOAT family O-acyltransferase [Pedobacter sp. SYP-B3415]
MFFSSPLFLAFFGTLFLVFYAIPVKWQSAFLVFCSLIYCSFFGAANLLIVACITAASFFVSRKIAASTRERARKMWLRLGVAVLVLTLAFFKYANIVAAELQGPLAETVVGILPGLKSLSAPVGISFYTLQALAYIIDVYRRNHQADDNPTHYTFFICFFPQIVAGPIERYHRIRSQLDVAKKFNYQPVTMGLRLFLYGLFKKIVVADNLAAFTNPIYGNLQEQTSLAIFIAVVLFSFQLYFDFSGYSDMARGVARMLGFDLMRNFDYPFNSTSVTEFWRRWHISLSSWLNDYIFQPLMIALRNKNKAGIIVSLFITFLVSGIWHGSTWNFVIFGMLHGLLCSYEFLTRKKRKRLFNALPSLLRKPVGIMLTFGFLNFTWIFFRVGSVAEAVYILQRMTGVFYDLAAYLTAGKTIFDGNMSSLNIFFCFLFVFIGLLLDQIDRRYDLLACLNQMKVPVRWFAYFSMCLCIMLFSSPQVYSFVYFQF